MLCAVGGFTARAGEAVRYVDVLRGENYATIELRATAENHWYQIGRLNGKRASCLVDTGWSFTTAQTNMVVTGGGADVLSLGRVSFTNPPVRVKAMLFNGQPASFSIVLGLDFLRMNFAWMDCGAARLHTGTAALSGAAQERMEDALRRAGYREVELKLKSPPALTVVVKVNGEPMEFLVDSGAAWSCLDQRQSARLKLKAMASPARITGAGATGTRPVAVVEVKSLQVGEVNLSSTLALFDLADWGFAAPDQTLKEIQGIFGGELLKATSAVIDCHKLKLWIKQPTRR